MNHWFLLVITKTSLIGEGLGMNFCLALYLWATSHQIRFVSVQEGSFSEEDSKLCWCGSSILQIPSLADLVAEYFITENRVCCGVCEADLKCKVLRAG